MKKISYIILSFISLFCVYRVYAHPLDITVSTASISGNKIQITTYFHSYEIDYLLRENNKQLPNGVADYFEYSDVITDYISDNIIIKNNTQVCVLSHIELQQDEVYAILSDGLAVSYGFDCSEELENIFFSLNYFIEFPLQTNRITLYDVSGGLLGAQPILYKVLTAKKPYMSVDIYNTAHVQQRDSDNDGLSDEDEKIYATNPNNPDSDNDGYSDTEELEYGWNPLDSDLGPGQELRDEFDQELSSQQIDKLQNILGDVKEKNISDFSGQGSVVLKDTMKYMSDFFEWNQGNIFGVFLFVFTLGILHTLGPGHSKGLLISYTLEKQNGYLKGFLFAGVFTLTHIIDIILLLIVARSLGGVLQSNYTYMIQVSSAMLLFCFGIYLVYRAIKNQKRKETGAKNQNSLWVAFLAGLAPCSFAWSIFLLLSALGKPAWIIPLVVALGLGIFVTLCGIVLVSVFLKQQMYHRVKKLGFYSSLFSAIMILIISIVMLMKIL